MTKPNLPISAQVSNDPAAPFGYAEPHPASRYPRTEPEFQAIRLVEALTAAEAVVDMATTGKPEVPVLTANPGAAMLLRDLVKKELRILAVTARSWFVFRGVRYTQETYIERGPMTKDAAERFANRAAGVPRFVMRRDEAYHAYPERIRHYEEEMRHDNHDPLRP